MKGVLYVVATPLGNLGDFSPRAQETLSGAAMVLAESKEATARLCQKNGISTPVQALYPDKSENPYSFVLAGLESGRNYALVSDAGTPGISDPGGALVRAVREKGFRVSPIPGPSALSSLVSVSGWQAQPLLFLGFLSETPGKKRRELESAQEFSGILAFFESVHRLPRLYPLLTELFPKAPVLVGRELTKVHEEIRYYPDPKELLADPPLAKGEFTFLLNLRKKTLKGFFKSADAGK